MEYYWPAAAHSAGVKVHGQRVHRLGLHLAFQRGIHHLVARDGALALELGETMVANQWRPSPSTCRCSQAGRRR
jgi:hypothetical protein